ncbi:MAG: BtpA/SgcQ family protein [Nanoarchaeota archaeon]
MFNFRRVFRTPKPVIGMIHLSGDTHEQKLVRALEELAIYESEGVDGAIVENFHGDMNNLMDAMEAIAERDNKLVVGVNALGRIGDAFSLASHYGGSFVQVDSVQPRDFDLDYWSDVRKANPRLIVLGGVRFKYSRESMRTLPDSLKVAMDRCDAIVTTGEGTGEETPIDKLQDFKRLAPSFPVIAGSGVEKHNCYETLDNCDGIIVGSYFKPGKDTTLRVNPAKVREIMTIAREVRSKYK